MLRLTLLECDCVAPPDLEAGQLFGCRREKVWQLETHVDDRSPEQLSHAARSCFAAGALDVTERTVYRDWRNARAFLASELKTSG